MGALLGLTGAVAIGLSDLFGRRIVAASTPLTAAIVLQVFGALISAATIVAIPSAWVWDDMALSVLSGIGMGVGLSCYYTGLARSTSTVVAPLVATVSTVLPFGYVQLTGDAISGFGLAAAGVAVIGLVFITTGADEISNLGAGVRWGLLSGLGYGTATAVLSDVSEVSGALPAVGQRSAAFVLLATVATVGGVRILPPRRLAGTSTVAGALAAVTTMALLLGIQADATGAVIGLSMFPAFSVVVGRVFFGDPIRRSQALGIGLAVLGTAGVVAG